MELIFVYNAHSGVLNKGVDFLHKVFSPATYQCELCKLTHHQLGEKSDWKKFRLQFEGRMRFLYLEEFEQEFSFRKDYPFVFKIEEEDVEIVLEKQELTQLSTEKELIKMLIMYFQAE